MSPFLQTIELVLSFLLRNLELLLDLADLGLEVLVSRFDGIELLVGLLPLVHLVRHVFHIVELLSELVGLDQLQLAVDPLLRRLDSAHVFHQLLKLSLLVH